MSVFGRALADGDRLEMAGLVIRLKVNRRARRVNLRLDRTRREIIATAPSPRRLAEAAAFAKDRLGWIQERLAELPEPQPLAPGMTLAVFGQPCRLEAGTGRPRWCPPGADGVARIVAPGEGRAFALATIRALKARALEVLSERTRHHCDVLDVPLPQVAVADAKSRWGSCRPAYGRKPAAIRYSWRLALAPWAVADYVAAHECAHLLELNHSPRFWAHVRRLIGDERPHRAWLRAHGVRLHAIGTE
ncbi:MAG: SprT family zinc-dependent metalloprotease [Phenylobacterium sp.]|jgi:predicted metal-dependent hydrolase|uniref:M48 family metallopeptidase n=1 Tax=Phenylobacterium sp. TaxID=1871053 RepID=UPI002A35EB0B|nr:SprT family zinc-dependent metalloprotease [Phenylobacterium sp.]MDX9996573.1 SprT family zinc-dependent metalloprotease [Phenylobacterium sp.]